MTAAAATLATPAHAYYLTYATAFAAHHAAFRRGGRKAIERVMRNQPAVFLKLLVLLVPRQMTLDHSGGVKAMSDEQIERSIELIKGMLAEREAAANAKVIGGIAEPVPALPPPCRERKKTAPPSAGKTS